MAEAHAAVHLLSSEIPGQKPTKIVLQQDDDDIFSISFRKSFIRFLRMMKRRVYDFRNELKNAIFPHSWFSYFFSVCAPPAVMMSARAGNLPGIRAIRQGLWGFANQLPSWAGQRIGRVAITSAVAGTGVFFSLLVLRRMALRTLLSYRGWLYQQPRTQSKRVLLWGALVQALTGRHPLLFSFSRSLPQLPVPGLKDTVDRYLTSIESVLPPAEVAKNKSLAAAFLKTEGPRLQRYLVLKSWLADNYVTDWWERYVYLFPRAPILINSNYYVSDVVNIIPTHHPCSRAAGLISAILRFKQSVDRETLEPLVIRDTVPLCMEQYRRMFSTTRIPKKGGDQILHLDRNESRHIVVFVKGSYFVLELYSDLGKPLHAFEIEGQLERIAEEASTKEPSATEQQVAALTGLDRDKWAEAREVFFSHGVNRQSLELIEKAMFVLVLDSEAPDTLTEHGKLSLHGKGFDRWFDKSFNLIVYANGKAGLNCEHSWADAPVIGHMWETTMFVENVEGSYDSKGRCVVPLGAKRRALSQPLCLVWSFSQPAKAAVEEAILANQLLIDNLHLRVVPFEEYGKELIKTFKVSPDGCVQMALQLAFYKGNKFTPLTYESSMTRLYQLGRTETVRSASTQSVDFVMSMFDESVSVDERIRLFKEACDKHQNTYREAMSGKGVDRHLFALYICSRGLGVESDFLKAALSEPWRLSTSQTPQQQTRLWEATYGKYKNFYAPGGGFGPVADDGYGVSYMVLEHCVFFHVSSKRSCPTTDSDRFAEDIMWALMEIKNLFAAAKK